MCRNITTLRGLDPEATAEEIDAAARQYVRKVSGVQKPTARTEAAFDLAVRQVAAGGSRAAPWSPPTLPPLRRLRTSAAPA